MILKALPPIFKSYCHAISPVSTSIFIDTWIPVYASASVCVCVDVVRVAACVEERESVCVNALFDEQCCDVPV